MGACVSAQHNGDAEADVGMGSVKKPSVDTSAGKMSKRRLASFFATWAGVKEDEEEDDMEDEIGPNGMAALMGALGLDPDSILSFVLSWHCGATEMGYMTREEFLTGMTKLGVDSLDKLRAHIPQLEADLSANAKDIFVYAFNISKVSQSRTLELEMAQIIIPLFLPAHKYPHTETFLQFVREQQSYKAINKDQWSNWYDFATTINDDFSNFDEDGAWPCMLDEYVVWGRDHLQRAEGTGF